MLAPWAIEEMEPADLGDKRLNRRLAQILSHFADRPTASIPAACGGHAEMTAAYRFFDNDKVTFAKTLQPHIEHTLERVAAQPIALLVQDTTEIDLSRPELDVDGAGPLADAARRGVFLHPLHAFTPDGTPLGTAWAKTWARDDEPDLTKAEKRKRRKAAPIEAKESVRWLEGLRQARHVAEVAQETTCVCISDSESYIYELFIEPREGVAGRPVEWLIRACQDRGLIASEAAPEIARLRAAALAAPVLFTREISVRGRTPKTACEDRARRQPRCDRKAFMSARATVTTLRPPARPGQKLPPVTVNVVLVREDAPPEGEEPIEWLLITTLPIETIEDVRTIIAYYTVRWLIELLFRILKSGCRVERRRFEHVDRLLPCAAVYLIVAWRTLLVCRMGRSCPDISCEAIFEPAEWQSVYVTVLKKPVPAEPPSLETMVRLIAQLGGYVNRAKRKDPPGVQTIWLGMQRMQDLALAWVSFGPGARAELV
jgi:Transposase DNA-binding/Transposase Tn5 dimerisation domain/Transposase DDE domain